MRQGAARVGWAATEVLALVLVAVPARGQVSDFPVTAYSRSLNIRPEFVDETSLLFVFPQRGGILSTRLFALGNESFLSPAGVGILGSTGRVAGFLLVQDERSFGDDPLFQGGVAASWNPVRFGAALRIARGQTESGYYSRRSDMVYFNFGSQERTIYQGVVGLGVGRDRVGADATLEINRVDSRIESIQADRDTLGLRLESDDTLAYGFSARFHARFDAEVEVTALGGWGRVEANYTGMELTGNQLLAVEQGVVFEGWYTGLATSFTSTHVDWMALSAHWRRRQVPWGVQFSGPLSRNSSDRGGVAFSVREKLWRQLWGSAGVGMSYEKEGVETLRRNALQTDFNQNSSTNLRGEFGWGVSYDWRQFDVRGAVRSDFPAGALFTSLDLLVHL